MTTNREILSHSDTIRPPDRNLVRLGHGEKAPSLQSCEDRGQDVRISVQVPLNDYSDVSIGNAKRHCRREPWKGPIPGIVVGEAATWLHLQRCGTTFRTSRFVPLVSGGRTGSAAAPSGTPSAMIKHRPCVSCYLWRALIGFSKPLRAGEDLSCMSAGLATETSQAPGLLLG